MITDRSHVFEFANNTSAFTLKCQPVNCCTICCGPWRLMATTDYLVAIRQCAANTGAVVYYTSDATTWRATCPDGIVHHPSSGACICIPSTVASGGGVAMYATCAKQIVTTTSGDIWQTTPAGGIQICNANGVSVALYSNSVQLFDGHKAGAYLITNVASGSCYSRISSLCLNASCCYPNMIVYTNCAWLVSTPCTGVTANIQAGFSYGALSTTSINGTTFLSISGMMGLAANGTGAAIIDARTGTSAACHKIGWISNVTEARSVASIAAGVLEIDNA